MTVVDYKDTRIMIDCGAYYPDGEGTYEERQEEADQRNFEMPVDAASVDAVILTHAHLDHTGRVPLLWKKGYKGPIYCTPGTQKISDVMLIMQLRYSAEPRNWRYSKASIKKGFGGGKYVTAHWTHCKYSSSIKAENLVSFNGSLKEAEKSAGLDFSPCYRCASDQYYYISQLFKPSVCGKDIQVSAGVWFRFLDAGHIPASASVLLKLLRSPGDTLKLLFSGDIGNDLSPLIYCPKPAPKADAVFIESTYGGVIRDPVTKDDLTRFPQDVARIVKAGGVAWIPAFALDRTQKILFAIKEGMESGIIPKNVPIFCPSPSAGDISNLYLEEHRTRAQRWFRNEIYSEASLFPAYDSILPYDDLPRPCILITTSGMMDEAFSKLMLDKLLPDPSTGVFQVGYQDPGSPGGQLKQQTGTVVWEDKVIPVAAKVYSYKAFSAHGDLNDILNFLKNQDKGKVKIYLVHGDSEALDAQLQKLTVGGFNSVKVARKAEKLIF
jgi:metallo-beta-lactamase family protein